MKIHAYKLNKATAKQLVKSTLEGKLGLKAKWDIKLLEMGKVGSHIRVLAEIGETEYEITGNTETSTFTSLHDGYDKDEIFPIYKANLTIALNHFNNGIDTVRVIEKYNY